MSAQPDASRGGPSQPWSLARSIETLALASHEAARPGSIWLAGVAYQVIVMGWFSGALIAGTLAKSPSLGSWSAALRRSSLETLPSLGEILVHLGKDPSSALVLIPLVLLLFRLTLGLARLVRPETWDPIRRRPRLRRVWTTGRGLTRSGLGLWLQFLLMMMGATLLFIAPARLFAHLAPARDIGILTAVLSGMLVALLLLYSLLLSLLFQIALHSLVANQRGIGSAVLHAWRIVRNTPLGSLHAVLADAVLTVTVTAIEIAVVLVTSIVSLPGVVTWLVLVALTGILGVARAIYWSRVYRRLGGVATAESRQEG